jgi:hypothetical protein
MNAGCGGSNRSKPAETPCANPDVAHVADINAMKAIDFPGKPKIRERPGCPNRKRKEFIFIRVIENLLSLTRHANEGDGSRLAELSEGVSIHSIRTGQMTISHAAGTRYVRNG